MSRRTAQTDFGIPIVTLIVGIILAVLGFYSDSAERFRAYMVIGGVIIGLRGLYQIVAPMIETDGTPEADIAQARKVKWGLFTITILGLLMAIFADFFGNSDLIFDIGIGTVIIGGILTLLVWGVEMTERKMAEENKRKSRISY